MRYLVYVLILANLAFFAWYQQFPGQKPAEVQPAPLPAGIDRLVLLSERPVHAGQGIQIEEIAALEQPREAPGAGAVSPETTTSVEGVGETRDKVSEAESDAAAGAPAVEPERLCHTVGPIRDKADAVSVSALLSGQGYQIKLRDGKVREPSGYWVYLPEMPSRDARRIVADLDAQGMKDYYIGKNNRISLGIFSKKAKALGRQQQVKSLGYEALLDQRYRSRTAYWLDVEEQGQSLVDSDVWGKIQSKHTDIRAERASCE